jgi:hypothetical protein
MKVTINGVDRSASYKPDELEQISVRFVADQGEVGSGTMPQPDTAGTTEFYSGQSVLLEVGADTVADVFAGALNRDRNEGIGDRLVNVVTLSDQNAMLDGYATTRWSRPAETDRARILAFNSAFLSHLSLDTTWVLNTHTKTVAAKVYQSETLFSELQDDLGKPTGKTLFIVNRELHWHLYTEGDTAGIAIVEAESKNHAAGAFELLSQTAPQRSKDPIDLTVEAKAVNTKGQVATSLDTTAQTRHDSGGLRHEKLVDAGDTASSGLQDLADTAVAEGKTERITYAGTIGPLTAAQLADIPVGSLINVTDHVWGLSSATQRVAAYTLRYKHPNQFFLDLELGFPIRVRAQPPKTTPPSGLGQDGGVLPPYVCVPPDYTVPHCDDAMDTSPIVATAVAVGGSTWLDGSVITQGSVSGGGSEHGVNLIAGATYRVTYTFTHATTTFEANIAAVMEAGSHSFGGMTAGHDPAIGDGTDPAVYPPVYTYTLDVTPGDTGCYYAKMAEGSGYAGMNIVGSTMSVGVRWLSGADSRFDALVGCPAPLTGQAVTEQGFPGDGSTTAGTTGYPFEPKSLEVFVGGVHVTPSETDPTVGTYTLPMAPPAGIVPVLKYIATGGDATGTFVPPTSILEVIPDAFLPSASASGLVPWSYAKRDGHLVGDGVTDDTAAFQTWIDTVTASGTKSGWFFFEPGTYLIAGALQDTGARNAQILFPSLSTSDAQISMTFQGAMQPPLQPAGPFPSTQSYSIIKSTLTGASGTAAVFSGGQYPARTNVQVVVRHLMCEGPDNPTFTFWNLDACQSGGLEGVLIVAASSYTGSWVQPTHSNAYGVKLPHYGYTNSTFVNGFVVGGWYTGLRMTDLVVYQGIGFGACIVAVEIPQMQHSMWPLTLHYAACQYGVKVTGSDVYLDLTLSAEHWYSGVGSSWQFQVYDIDDPSNNFHGHVRWFTWSLNTGLPDHVFTINGGSHIASEEMGALPNAGQINGVSITGTPSAGQVPTATSGTAATWQTPSASGGGGTLLIADGHSSPLVFADILQSDAGDDFLYSG